MPHDDLAMMQRPDEWPAWPLLPLKKPASSGGWPEMGFLMELGREGVRPVVFLGTIFQASTAIPKEYTDLQAIVDDGWVVD